MTNLLSLDFDSTPLIYSQSALYLISFLLCTMFMDNMGNAMIRIVNRIMQGANLFCRNPVMLYRTMQFFERIADVFHLY